MLLNSWMFGSPKANPSTAPAKLLFPDDADSSSDNDSDNNSRKRSGSSSSSTAKKGAIADTDSSTTDSNMGPSRIDDGLLEVVAVTGALHLGQIQVGLGAGHPIAQCNELKITTTRKLPMQGKLC
jgi:Diacylglycerol kinase accessory domain